MGKEKGPDLYRESSPKENSTDQGFQQTLDRYSRAKRHLLSLCQFIAKDLDLRNEYTEMLKCGSLLIFKHWLLTGFRRLVSGFSCKKYLLCWPCALRRSARYIRKYSLVVRQVMLEKPFLVPVLITLTVKNGPDLGERHEHLERNHRKLIERRRQSLSRKTTARGKISNSVFQHVAGSVGTYEFKRGKNSGNWHPHIHQVALLEPVFVFSDKEVPGWARENGKWKKITRTVQCPLEFEKRLREEYLDISGDSYIVDVRRIEVGNLEDILDPPSIEDEPDQTIFTANTLIKALCEVFKYALKFSELSHEDQVYAYKTLKGKRLLFSYGCLFGVKLDESLTDPSVEDLEKGLYVYDMYRFLENEYRHTCRMDGETYERFERMNQQIRRFGHLFARDKKFLKPFIIDEDFAASQDAVLDEEVPF